MLDSLSASLFLAHKKMTNIDIMQIVNYRKADIRLPHMYVTFANIFRGYEKVGFIKKDIYYQDMRNMWLTTSDATGVLKYLRQLCDELSSVW